MWWKCCFQSSSFDISINLLDDVIFLALAYIIHGKRFFDGSMPEGTVHLTARSTSQRFEKYFFLSIVKFTNMQDAQLRLECNQNYVRW